MTCRIDRLSIEHGRVVSARQWADCRGRPGVFRTALEQDGGVVAIDLAEVDLVDRAVVKLLATSEANGIELRNCPAYIREVDRTRKDSLMTNLTDVVEATAIRPFQCECSGSGTYRIAQAHQRDQVARAGNGHGCIARRAARDDAGTRALLGDRLRLAQGRGEAERPAASSSPRSMGSTFISSTSVRNMRMRCRSSSRTDGPARSSSR